MGNEKLNAELVDYVTKTRGKLIGPMLVPEIMEMVRKHQLTTEGNILANALYSDKEYREKILDAVNDELHSPFRSCDASNPKHVDVINALAVVLDKEFIRPEKPNVLADSLANLKESLKSDYDYWHGWVANIAMCIHDEMGDEKANAVNCNNAAERFIALLCGEIPHKLKEREAEKVNHASKGIQAIIRNPEEVLREDVVEDHPGMITELVYNWHQSGNIRDDIGENYYQYRVCKGGVIAIHRMNGYFRVEFESGEYRDVYNPSEVTTMPYKSRNEIIEEAVKRKVKVLCKPKGNEEWSDFLTDSKLNFDVFDYRLK